MAWTKRPRFQLTCGACRRQIGQTTDVHLVDEEWLRRYDGIPLGKIVCDRCVRAQGSCFLTGSQYLPGHIPASHGPREDYDLYDHRVAWGSQRAMVTMDPRSGAVQGARDYLEAILDDPDYEPDARQAIDDALQTPLRLLT